MDDIKIILYILAAVAYFVFMQWRKAFNNPSQDVDDELPKPGRRAPYPAKPATSFEEILRELQPKLDQAEKREKEVIAEAKRMVAPVAPPLAPAAEATQQVRSYEDRAPKALSWEKPAEALQAAKNLKERRMQTWKDAVETQARKSHPYANLLKNPASVRDAVILTEIFNRKYN